MSLALLGQAHVCKRCAARGPTCCEPEEGVALAPLTPGDIRRISRATQRNPSDFVTERLIDADEAAAWTGEDPVLRGLVSDDGLLRSLAKQGNACVFHSASGCTLGYDVRPLLCRRFPVVRDRGALRVNPGGNCLALEEANNMPSLLQLLGLTEESLKQIDRQIRADLTPRRP
jgi:Fe-S-cluster containining protein